MTTFGVHSEVGKLRKVMVHRPGAEPAAAHPVQPRRAAVRRRAVGRARPVRARPVRRADARARRRGLPTPGPARRGAGRQRRRPAAADRARRLGVHRRASRWSTRSAAALAGLTPDALATPPDRRPDRRGVRARPRPAARHVADRGGRRRRRASSSCRRCRTPCSPATRRAGSTAASRSTRCSGRRAGARPTTWRRSTAATRCSPTADFEFWYPPLGDDERFDAEDFGLASLEGGDVEPSATARSLIGIERAHPGADDRADRPGAVRQGRRRAGHRRGDDQGPRAHAPRHGLHDARPRQGDGLSRRSSSDIRAISLRPGVNGRHAPRHARRRISSSAVADALGVPKLHVVETGGDAYQQEREQWDDGNNVVALEPGVVVAYERNTYTIAKMREAGVEVITDRGVRARQGPRRRALHDLPDRRATRSEEAAMNDRCAGSSRR